MNQILEYSEPAVIRLCLMEILRKVIGHGISERKRYEFFRGYTIRSDGEWLFEGRVRRTLLGLFGSEIFVIRIGSGWQVAEGQTRRYLYWNTEWKEDDTYSFADLQPLLQATMEKLAETLGKDGVVLKPSPEQLVSIELGELSQAKKTSNGSAGAHLDDFPEVSGTPS